MTPVFHRSILSSGLLVLTLAATPALAGEEAPWSQGLYGGAALGLSQGADETASGTSGGKVDFERGTALSAFVGKSFTDTLRAEIELNRKSVGLDSVAGSSGSGDAIATGVMANLILDIDAGLPVQPYVGAGAGMARLSLDGAGPFGGSTIDDNDTVRAYQAIAGAAYPLQDRLDVFADYRYFATSDGDFSTTAGNTTSLGIKTHSVMAGLRFSFGNSGPDMSGASQGLGGSVKDQRADTGANDAKTAMTRKDTPPPAPITEQAATMGQALPETYLVHFELNKAEVLPEAIAIIEDVASNAKANNLTRLVLSGHTDTSGPEAFNYELSKKRAESVRTAFIALGFKEDEVTIKALGETELLVPTADGVAEPKNRRVEIVIAQ